MSMMKNQPAHGALRAHPARHAAQDAWDNCEAEQAERAPPRAAGFDHAEGVEREAPARRCLGLCSDARSSISSAIWT